MTQTTYFLTNGNSLEDCHTNFFALADLCGIKWRQYSCDKNFNDLNDDPILSSFSRCINANLLCVWRRIRNTNNINNANTQDTNNPQQQNNYTNRDFNYFTKELWIFWYGDEPDLKDLVVPNLKEGEQGSWESGLSYECRTLLFKALHNLIERCLLSKGYSRIGRWFFQTKNRPQTSSSSSSSLCPKETGTSSSSVAAATTLKNDTTISDIIKEGTQITFRFNFFLHGDSNVCANVDVRQHTSIRPITRDDILIAQQLPDGIQVLLSPYGLQGYLTGHVYKDNDPNAQKLLSDWNKIYPLSSSTSNSSSSSSSANNNNTNINQQQQKSATTKDKLNDNEHFINNNNDLSQKIVEIIVDNNCRLKYPASYVFITDIDSELYRYKCQLQSPNNASNSSCPSSAQQQQQHQQQQIEKHRNFQELSKKLHKGSKEYLEQAKLLMTPYYNLKPNDSYYLRKNFNQINTVCDQIENKRDNSQSSSVKNGDIDYENNDNDKNNDEILILKNKCNCMKCINQIKHHQNKQCSLKQSSSSSSFTSMGKNISKDIKKWSSSSSQLLKNLSAINSSPFHHRVMNEIDLNNQFNSLHKLSKSSTTAAAVSTSSSIATLKNDDNSSKLTGEQSINNNNSQFKNTSGNNSNGPSTCDSSSSNPSFIQQQQQSQDHLHSQPTRPPSLPLSHHHQHNHHNSNIHIENTTIDPTARSNQQQMIKSIPQPSQPSPVPPIKEESALANLIAASTPILSNSHNNNQMIHRSLSPAIVNSDQSSTLKDSNNNNGDIDTKESVITNGYSNKRSKSSSFYDDDIAYKLLNGLLYDFSDEKLINNDWDFNDNDLPMKNRRFKSSHHFSSNNLYDASTHIMNGDYNSNLDNNSRSALCDYNPPQQTDKSSKSSSTPMINKLLSSSSMNNDNNSEVLRSNLSCNTNNDDNNNVSNIHGNDTMNVSSQSADNNNKFIKAKLSSSIENELINKNINAVNYNNTNINTNLHNHSKISEKLIVNHNGNLFVKNGEILPSDLEFLNSPLEEEQQLQQQQMNHKNNPNHIETETILPATTTNASATSSTSNNSTSVLGVAELSRMFPTPPSLEAMVSSPSSSFVTNDAQTNKPFNHNDKNNDIDTDSMPINNANTIINNNNNNSVNNNNQINIRTELQSLNSSMVNTNTINANQNQIITNKLKPLNDLESNEQALVYMPPVQSIFITSDKYLPLCNVECKDTLPPNFHYKHNTNINHRRSTNHSIQHHNNSDHHYHSHHQQLQQNHPYHHNNHPGMRSFSPNFSPFPNGGHPLNHQQQQQTPFFKLNQRFPSNHSMQQQNMNNTKMGQQFSSPMIRVPRSSSTNYPISPMTPGSSPLPPPPHSMHPSHSRLRQQISPLPSGGAGGGHSPYPLIDCNMNSPGSMLDNRRSPFMFPQPTQPGMMMAKNPMMMMSPYGPHSPHPSHLHHISNDNHLSMTIECNSLMLNLLLSDSMFNLFHDHNFESCSICVCNMNIKGNDYGIYLPEQLMHKDHNLHHQQQNNDQNCLTCTCGFSAISNRHLSYFAGLFYEDEVEITGVYYDPIEANKENLLILPSSDSHQKDQTTTIDAYVDKELRKCLSTVNDDQYIKLLLNQSTTIYPSTSTLANIMYCDRLRCYNNYDQNLNNQPLRSNKSHQVERLKNPLRLMYEDYTAIIQMSLQITRLDCHTPGPSTPKLFQHGGWPSNSPSQSHIGNNTGLNRSLLHDWQFINSNHPVNNHEVMLTLKTLQPLMQESVQRKGSMNEVTYNTVKGPLTWRQFHRLAGRGTECQCEPQPIPSLLVGYDRECVAMSPFGLKFWEKLSLEPYAITRDIYYVVIIQSEMESQLSKIRNFFKELSATYEILRLGRHIPLGKLSSDSGIYVAGKSSINNNNDQQNNTMDDWFQQLGNSDLAEKIRSFAKALYDLSPSFTPSAVGERLMKSSFHNNSAYSMGQQQHHDLSSSSSNMNNGINSNNANQQQSHLHHSHHQQQQQHQHHNHHHITMNGTSSSSYTSSSNAVSSNSLLSSSFNKNSQNINNNNNNIQQSKSSLNNGINNNNTNGPTQQQQSDNNAANNNNNNQILNDLDTSHGSTSNQDSHNQSNTSTTTNNAFQPYDEEEDPHKYPSVMIYVLESFSPFGKEMTKLGSIGLLKTFSLLKKYFPEQMRNNIHMQMLSIDSVCSNDKDFRDYSRLPQLKELAFASYGQCKQQLVIQSNIKSLTGLGPAASFDLFLKNKSSALNRTELFTTPYILASLKDKQTELTETFGDRRERSQILYCGYCLTEDKKWLIASCTNDRGDILHTKVININIPNRLRRRKASIRRFGLDKLMKFIQTVMAESVMPWRLVIGRVGRIGHGELRDWTFLLSKKSLQKYSRQLKEMCNQCRYVGPNDQPAIYSACLISLEADTALRVFPNYYTPDERFSSSCNTCGLSTPEDASCTHILVFPTSATTQSSHTNFNLADEFFGDLGDDNLESDIPVDEDDFLDFFSDDILHRDGLQPDSPSNRQMFDTSDSLKNSSLMEVDHDEPTQLSQQPLALAFYVSTARTGPLPRWFWSHCPHLENTCPVFLKSALLIHTPSVHQNTDDLFHSNNRDGHSLDSNLTTDVLRYSLEGYNALSWLILDPSTNDRLSCLPLHIQVLMQLYHTIQALVQ